MDKKQDTAGIIERLDLDAIEARAKAATQGPWAAFTDDDHSNVVSFGGGETTFVFSLPGRSKREPDVDFIAHARTDIPALIAEVRALRARAHKGEG